MAAYNTFQAHVEDICKGLHDLSADALTIFLTPTASAPVATNTVLANLTETVYTNLSTRVLASVTAAHTAGTFKLDAADHVLTASGAVAAFQYVGIYNDTPTTPKADPLICWFDHGSSVTLADGETYTITFDAGGIYTLA